jgi:tetratricopeptide (TPR) repeat protein
MNASKPPGDRADSTVQVTPGGRGSPRQKSKKRRRARRYWPWLGPLVLVLGAATGAYWRQLWQWSGELRSSRVVAPALAQLPRLIRPIDLEALGNAITEMDVARARQLAEDYQRGSLSVAESHRLGVERARLGLYVGDCDAAEAILATLPPEQDQVVGLLDLARRCAGATAASRVVEDEGLGIWVRLQDADDAPLVPYLVQVANQAREAVRVDLGVDLPRPLRIDVVRDLFSLSAVSGLPLEAAETTGTVAVARWGRVTLLSPRASRHGYPWEDTLAHELVHLGLSRATRDFAPLWLQEGVAKRQEQRWRPPRPFDDAGEHDSVAERALATGRSVGVDSLGPSIAMLPSADAASIAFAEVTSFINFWIAQNGRGAFRLLLADLKGLEQRDPGAALRSVTGSGLEEWIARWQDYLRAQGAAAGAAEASKAAADAAQAALNSGKPVDAVPEAPGAPPAASPDMRGVRLGDLLLRGQHYKAAARLFEQTLAAAPRVGALRFRASEAELAANHPEAARERLGRLEELDGPHAGWFALKGRFDAEAGELKNAEEAARMASSLDPWSELVACEGHLRALLGSDPWELPDPSDPTRQKLCFMARARPPVQ